MNFLTLFDTFSFILYKLLFCTDSLILCHFYFLKVTYYFLLISLIYFKFFKFHPHNLFTIFICLLISNFFINISYAGYSGITQIFSLFYFKFIINLIYLLIFISLFLTTQFVLVLYYFFNFATNQS